MSNRIMSADEMLELTQQHIDEIVAKYGLDAGARAELIDALSMAMFYAPTFEGPKK